MAKQAERRPRRTAKELFLDKLSKLTKGEQTLVLNATLQHCVRSLDGPLRNIRMSVFN
jgi:hypothetical protein